MFEKFIPKFVKQYAKLGGDIRLAVSNYIEEVKAGEFPGEEHSF